MEDHSYVSCIKINGVPILPPLITEDIKEKMSNYKKSAINVERKLARLCVAKQYYNHIYVRKIKKESKDIKHKKQVHAFKENLLPFEYKNSNDNHNETNVTDRNSVPIEMFGSSDENIGKALQCGKNLSMTDKFEDQINLAPNTLSRLEPTTDSIDTDHCFNETVSTESSSMETISEIWKPQVPKTLNIIPLTVSDSNCKENKEYQEGVSNNLENTPKLKRQGSYVLETPSPMLLAHMQMELASSTCAPCLEYIPTSRTNTNRRKEWNVTQAKIEWEFETKNKEFVPIDSLRSSSMPKGNFYSNVDRTMCKSVSLEAKPESFAMYPSTKSADCIQTILAKEHIDDSDIEINHNKNYIIDSSNEKERNHQALNKFNNPCMVNSKCKFRRSSEDLNEHNNSPITNNLMGNLSKNIELLKSSSKFKSSIVSDKLLTVYKKVQEMHKKQMAELIFRQQKEQTLLQKEFEKQQLLLLTEIKKSFPEISASLLSENILSPTFNQIIPNGDKCFENNDNTLQNVRKLNKNFEQENEIECSQDDMKMISCPLDYIYSEISGDSVPYLTKCSYKVQSTETESLSNINTSELRAENKDMVVQSKEVNLLQESNECNKRSNVSRELFPLDSKTVHVPVLDRTIYDANHVKAANIINAYAKGYLIRRIMRTDRVIALKNTYKEALHCMLKLHVDAPLNRSEFNFLHRLQLQCDAASMNIVELFAQSPRKRMQVIAQDREIKQSRIERPTSARSYSFATQRTLARKKLKEMEEYQPTSFVRPCLSRSRCQTWTSDIKDRLISSNILYHSIKRSTSAGTVRKPWR